MRSGTQWQCVVEPLAGSTLTAAAALSALARNPRLKESRPMVVRDLNDAIVPNEGASPLSVQPPEAFTTKAAIEVWQELGAKCLYLSTVSSGGASWRQAGLLGVCVSALTVGTFTNKLARSRRHLLSDACICPAEYYRHLVI
jgi:hypothetical protein